MSRTVFSVPTWRARLGDMRRHPLLRARARLIVPAIWAGVFGVLSASRNTVVWRPVTQVIGADCPTPRGSKPTTSNARLTLGATLSAM